MSKTSQTHYSPENLHHMLDYLHEEIEQAETVEDLSSLLTVVKAMMTQVRPINAVQGLPNIRAEVTPSLISSDCNVATHVPESLVSTFYDLSNKMNQLQAEDPESFANASNALHWLANSDKSVN
ncbi:hypothetical protein [Magnetovibrio sp.]|uniref:hypothetical protein n=1 Tax=Magnetovibrio sp. TaxID=2024836 RepID=UPI002F946F51